MKLPRLVVLACAAAVALSSARADFFKLQVVDSQTGRGTPLVEVKTLDGTTWYTDSNGIVAIDEPSRLGMTLHFSLASYGYQNAAQTIFTAPGGSAQVAVERSNRAERLYRVTGQGIYEDSVQLGVPTPLARPVLNANVTGQDSVQTALYQGKVFWIWGDTNYVGGGFNLRAAGATSELPGQGGLDPSLGVNLNYFTAAGGNAKQMMPMNDPGLVWLDGLFTVPDNSGQERLLAHYSRVQGDFSLLEHGLALYNDSTQAFQRFKVYDLNAPIMPQGHDFRATVDGQEYIYFAQPYGNIRVKSDWDHVTDISQWEAYTPLEENSRYSAQNPPLEHDGDGNPVFGWKKNVDPFGREMLNELVQKSHLERSDSPFRMQELGTGKTIDMQRSSIQWNEYRKNWIMIGQQAWGDSLIGEIWFAEAPTPEGPWENAVKVATHARPGATYSFYNPALHEYFDQEGGQYIYFEGTYTAWLGSAPATPLYDYNQMMYRLDLSTIPQLAPLGGDYDRDGDVDGADLLSWQRSLGSTVPSATDADVNGDGRVDQADLAPWELRFGAGAVPPITSSAQLVVPEPAVPMLIMAAVAIAFSHLRRQSGAERPRRQVVQF